MFKRLLFIFVLSTGIFQCLSEDADECDPTSLVSIRKKGNNETVHVSGGISLSLNWVITVADLFHKEEAEDLFIGTGPEIVKNLLNYRGQLYAVTSIVIHPQFNESSLANNLAMLYIKNPLKHVTPARIPETELEEDITFTFCKTDTSLIKWTLTENFLELVCQYVGFPNFYDCIEKYKNANKFEVTEIEHECLDDAENRSGEEIIFSEKGLPLFCNDTLMAISSFRLNNYPLVISRLDRHLEFIKESMESEDDTNENALKAMRNNVGRMVFNRLLLLLLFVRN
ncbi:unnamed protein product [Phyllotreta striolata]|uniref:Peptidase S1 domain-containing protein n=1 Tax=Phyllotreta striolata TaxID=444603 RepID=A0A9N9XJ07_PHYSR|nr:unnamed protein product [Phyllotreta striolata]